MAENGVIGRENTIPWHLPADLNRFRQRTTGHHIIMGRTTFESIGRPLPGRTSIVITHTLDFDPEGAHAAPNLDNALRLAEADDEVFVIGGAQIYRLALPRADRLYLTIVHAAVPGDTYFPPFDPDDWRLVEDERHAADDRHAYPYSFRTYERRRSSKSGNGPPS
jgi:dihydrofolate reductase